jgi:hypothetical protein
MKPLQTMAKPMRSGLFLFACGLGTAAGVSAARGAAQSAVPFGDDKAQPVIVIQAYDAGLDGVCTTNPGVHLSVARDASIGDEPVLTVEYPPPTKDPAGRDVRCAAKNHDWSAGRAIAFQIKPDHALRLSVSFLDRNRVAYTAWTTLKGGMWQLVQIPFDEIRPNPFFQPPDAKTGARIDVSEVMGVAFAPQDQTSGRLTIGKFVVSK